MNDDEALAEEAGADTSDLLEARTGARRRRAAQARRNARLPMITPGGVLTSADRLGARKAGRGCEPVERGKTRSRSGGVFMGFSGV